MSSMTTTIPPPDSVTVAPRDRSLMPAHASSGSGTIVAPAHP
jgi:hypothetical protein